MELLYSCWIVVINKLYKEIMGVLCDIKEMSSDTKNEGASKGYQPNKAQQ